MIESLQKDKKANYSLKSRWSFKTILFSQYYNS